MKVSLARSLLAAVPALVLLLSPVFVNRVEPRILGLPFILAWLVAWVALTPVFLLAVERLRSKP